MPKLYGYPACPRSRMALVAASEKGIDCSFQAVASWDGLDKLPIFTSLHPFQRVPVLEHGGLRITETLAILMFIEPAFEGQPLVPDEPLALARMWEIISATTSYAWSPWVQALAMNRIIKPIAGDGADEAAIAAYLPEMCRAAEVIGGYLAAREETFDLADIVVAGALKYATETPEGERIARSAPALEQYPVVCRAARFSRAGLFRSGFMRVSGFGAASPSTRISLRAYGVPPLPKDSLSLQANLGDFTGEGRKPC